MKRKKCGFWITFQLQIRFTSSNNFNIDTIRDIHGTEKPEGILKPQKQLLVYDRRSDDGVSNACGSWQPIGCDDIFAII